MELGRDHGGGTQIFDGPTLVTATQLSLIEPTDALSQAIDLAAEAIDLLQANGIEAEDLFARWEAFDPLS